MDHNVPARINALALRVPNLLRRRVANSQCTMKRTLRIPPRNRIDTFWNLVIARPDLRPNTTSPKSHAVSLQHLPVSHQHH